MHGLTDFVYRGGMRRRDRWLAEPGPIVYRDFWDRFADWMVTLTGVVLVAMALVFALLIMQGG